MSESITHELRQLATGPMCLNAEHAATCNMLLAAAREIDRLRSQLDSEAHGHQTMTAEVERLANEIERLRTALQQIDEGHCLCPDKHDRSECLCWMWISQAALAEPAAQSAESEEPKQ